ncbi:dihydroneopterin aldolase [Paremcibacter congregatus]|uniref:dihydroneopterin aldolase n=1 Tax=Paremcibacter congregatus TaxID=2043170 RepID=A0A2G4YRM2_9PROT|nr:dihydroneopterin aldolase [Paremcibacter congregatus]PHZ84106.1 dihydroneopterin aldolase [Paremcibacter congregatus]QDE25834.1 dihydroneopterin aldolase [Paremcibacter congregatus]
MTAFTVTRQEIILKEFRHPVSIGIHDHERRAPQNILFTVTIGLDQEIPGDDIRHTLDYDFLRREIAALTDGRHFNLQETLAQEILQICFKQNEVTFARVALAKPDVYPDCVSVGYTVEARRA